MTEFREYLLQIAAVSLLVSLVLSLVPQGNIRKSVRFCGMLLVILTVLSPVLKLKAEDLENAVSSWWGRLEEMQTDVKQQNQQLLTDRIKQDCEAYVLDKAVQHGIELEVEINLETQTGLPYPESIYLQGAFSEAQKREFQILLEEDLGIPKERQEWNSP